MKKIITSILLMYCFCLFGQHPKVEKETMEDCKYIVEEMPLFGDWTSDSLSYSARKQRSDQELLKYFFKHFKYPKEIQHCYYTRLMIEFTIGKDGSISKIKFLRESHKTLEKEARRILEMMPKWTPGKMNGQPISVCYRLPIRLELN